MALSEAVDELVVALGDRVKPEHVALVALCRHLAGACDADPDKAALAGEFRGALSTLMEATADDGPDELVDFFAKARSRLSAVGDARN